MYENELFWSMIGNIILLLCLLSPNIVFEIHRRHFIWKNTNEWGYSTPKQYRYSKGTIVTLLDSDVEYVILETGRHDYLIRRVIYHNDTGLDQRIVLQSEIKLK